MQPVSSHAWDNERIRRPNADPFFLPGGSTGCLLIHGFSGSPAEMRGLGNYLTAQGHTVLGIRLAGHGGSPEALGAVYWRDWFASAEAGFNHLRQNCTTIVVVGFSFGGALAVLLARARLFERLVLLATPVRLQGDWRINVLPLARHIMPWFYPLAQADLSDAYVQHQIREHMPDIDLDDPDIQRHIRRSAKISVGAIDELRKALGKTRAALPRVRMPTLVMHGRMDNTVPLQNSEAIMARIGTPDKQFVLWEHTGHQMLVIGSERAAIYERIAMFVARGLC